MKIKKILPVFVSLLMMIFIIAASAFINKSNAPHKRNLINNRNNQTIQSTDDTAVNTNEMRGIWVTYMDLTMENEKEKSAEAFESKFKNIVKKSKEYGFNTLIVQVRPFCDALYKSKYFPYSHIISGEQGKDPNYDPLKIMCEICKNSNMQIHAWVNPYRVSTNNTPAKLSSDNPYIKDTTLGIETDTGIYLDPSNENARELIIKGVVEIAENYDVDGIQFDDYFYPTKDTDFDSSQYESYKSKASDKSYMNLDNWRKANVNMLICEAYRAIHSTGKNVVFGISPQGNIDNNEELYADVRTWCTCRGFVDYICPQIYFSLENPALGFESSLESWTQLEFADNVSLYIGLAGYKAGTDNDEGTWENSNDILLSEYKIIKQNSPVKGFMLYSYASLDDENAQVELNNLKSGLY